MKIAINKCFGGFGLSDEALHLYASKKGLSLYEKEISDTYLKIYYTDPEFSSDSYFSDSELYRDDPVLIEVIEELGEKANGRHANISIVDVDDDVSDWLIHDYDGIESVHEAHRVWG